MTLDVLLLISGGLLAILGGGLVLFLSPGPYPSLLASIALASLGLLQFGWARAIYDVLWSTGSTWFELSLAFALPVSLCWVLLSRTLGLGPHPAPLGPWRYYIAAHAVFSLAALLLVTLVPSAAPVELEGGASTFPLRPLGSAMLLGVLLNLVLASASFESTYLSFPRAKRRAFRPGLFAILAGAGYFTYVAVSSLLADRVSVPDLALGAFPVAVLAILLPFSLVRGRLAEARVRREKQPLTRTGSLIISVGALLGVYGVLWLTRATGWSLARGLWVFVALSVTLALAALAISNRLQRRVQRFIDPYLYRRRIDPREIQTRVGEAVGRTHSLAELCRIIPPNTRELLGADPVTLFLSDERQARFTVVASTLDPAPSVAVTAGEPLAVELRRAGRAIRVRGRADDLEFIPIYVENASQIAACMAACAAPITREEELFGFLLCGERGSDPDRRRDLLPLLDTICAGYSSRVEALAREADRIERV